MAETARSTTTRDTQAAQSHNLASDIVSSEKIFLLLLKRGCSIGEETYDAPSFKIRVVHVLSSAIGDVIFSDTLLCLSTTHVEQTGS